MCNQQGNHRSPIKQRRGPWFGRALPCSNARSGSVLIYSLFMMVIMFAMTSLAVDYGRMQTIKTELQRDADVTARGALQMYVSDGPSTAYAIAPVMALNSYNPVDSGTGIQPTITETWGSWNAASKTFIPGSTLSPMAVKITVSRAVANGNPVPLTFPLMNGLSGVFKTCDVIATAVAVLGTTTSTTATISGQSDPWLAGMPNGSQASDYDTAPAQSPPMVLNVTPGSIITFTNVSGGVTNDPSIPNDGPNGDAGQLHSHNDDDPINEPGVQNNIGNVTMPINALLGLFLTNNAPNTQPAPTGSLNYSTAAERTEATYSSIQVQQPFFIGTGQTSSGRTQTFVVPQGATRLYLGTMDGHQWNNNSGSFSATITQQQSIYLVQ